MSRYIVSLFTYDWGIEECKTRTKDSMSIIHISVFGDVLKKSVLCMGKYGTV